MNNQFDFIFKNNCKGVILDSGDGEYIVKGSVQTKTNNATLMYWAANPPSYLTSFSGSGLPYPNPEIAYENTPNRGAVKISGGIYQFRVRFPNAYYVGLGSVYVEPCVHIKVCEEGGDGKINTIKLGNGIPFRSLTYPPTQNGTLAREGPMFYKGLEELPIRSQEEILRSSGYPEKNEMPANFWGGKPPK